MFKNSKIAKCILHSIYLGSVGFLGFSWVTITPVTKFNSETSQKAIGNTNSVKLFLNSVDARRLRPGIV